MKDYSPTDALAIYYYAADEQIVDEKCSYTESFASEYIEFANNNMSISEDEYYEKYVGKSANFLTASFFSGQKCFVPENVLRKSDFELEDIEKIRGEQTGYV